jgi:hypothetical protein
MLSVTEANATPASARVLKVSSVTARLRAQRSIE